MKILNELRAREWAYILWLPFIGYIFAAGLVVSLQVFLLLGASVCSIMFAYILDSSRRKGLLVSLPAISFVLSFLISPIALVLVLFGHVLVIAYSLSPFRLKGVPMVGTLLNGAGFGMLVFFGSIAGGRLDMAALMFSSFCGLSVVPLQLIHEIEHMRNDKKSGHSTTAVAFGEKKSRTLALVFLTALVIYAHFAVPAFLLPAAVFAILVGASIIIEKNAGKARKISRIVSVGFGLAILAIIL